MTQLGTPGVGYTRGGAAVHGWRAVFHYHYGHP